jgi:hypothetical protein
MSFEEIFAPGLRHWREQRDWEEDDSHHLTAEADPFEEMLESGTVVIRPTRPPASRGEAGEGG